MDLAILVYVISLLTPIGSLAMSITFICGFVIVGLMIYRGAECSQEDFYNAERNKKQKEKAEWAMGRVGLTLKVMIPTVLLLVLLPAPKTAYMMVGAYAAQKVVENKSVQDTSSKVLTLINQKLDHYIEEGVTEAMKVPEKAKEKVKKLGE
jgi:hypothetical protein